MKINVGDYVRTRYGEIGKLINTSKCDVFQDKKDYPFDNNVYNSFYGKGAIICGDNNVKINDLKKYGFNILISDEEYKKRLKSDETDIYCTRAHKKIGNHFELVVETDMFINQLTIVPDTSFGLNLCIDWQLDTLYDLIKADLIEKVEDK